MLALFISLHVFALFALLYVFALFLSFALHHCTHTGIASVAWRLWFCRRPDHGGCGVYSPLFIFPTSVFPSISRLCSRRQVT